MAPGDIRSRFALVYDRALHRRVIGKKEVIIHCHHYHSRIQNTIEGASGIDGKGILSTAAEAVFTEQLRDVIRKEDALETRWAVAAALYAHLGFGLLDFSQVEQGVVTSSSSHFVAGWNACFPERTAPACTFTEGYLQAAVSTILGELVYAHEETCMVSGAPECRFTLKRGRDVPMEVIDRKPVSFVPHAAEGFLRSPNVDEKVILDALVAMPIYGNDQGLIPQFGVYLANTPADFYNLVFIRFLEAMAKQGLFRTAKKLMTFEAEACSLNTFRGIMSSPEWDGLVAPMVKQEEDTLFGVVAISNGLGWGNWHVKQHTPHALLEMVSLNGYEALGGLELRGKASTPQCMAFTGLAAGIMELIYGEGSPQDRFGTYESTEQECISCGAPHCAFRVEKV
jgi:predicted hydrocarbon binding protein